MLDIKHLNNLRTAEVEEIARRFRPGARVLEIGAGTGQQTILLRDRGFEVEAIDLADSNYARDTLTDITLYDGRHIPFPEGSFDVAFSSNVLEHVLDLPQLHAEVRRVLKHPGGYAVHVVPSHVWRFWTSVAAFPAALQEARGALGHGAAPEAHGRPLRSALRALARPLAQRRHGERGNVVTELWYFTPRWWRRHFQEHHFEIVQEAPMGLFYTGHMVLGGRWPLSQRQRLAEALGSACHLFVIRPRP